MHDNKPAHRAKLTNDVLSHQQFVTIKKPAISPDMNPIENLWDIMKRELRSQGEVLSADQLFEVLKKDLGRIHS